MRASWIIPALRLAAFGLGVIVLFFALIPKPHLLDETSFSSCYLDRNGKLLATGTSACAILKS